MDTITLADIDSSDLGANSPPHGNRYNLAVPFIFVEISINFSTIFCIWLDTFLTPNDYFLGKCKTKDSNLSCKKCI